MSEEDQVQENQEYQEYQEYHKEFLKKYPDKSCKDFLIEIGCLTLDFLFLKMMNNLVLIYTIIVSMFAILVNKILFHIFIPVMPSWLSWGLWCWIFIMVHRRVYYFLKK